VAVTPPPPEGRGGIAENQPHWVVSLARKATGQNTKPNVPNQLCSGAESKQSVWTGTSVDSAKRPGSWVRSLRNRPGYHRGVVLHVGRCDSLVNGGHDLHGLPLKPLRIESRDEGMLFVALVILQRQANARRGQNSTRVVRCAAWRQRKARLRQLVLRNVGQGLRDAGGASRLTWRRSPILLALLPNRRQIRRGWQLLLLLVTRGMGVWSHRLGQWGCCCARQNLKG
jgi:hypothetical protein